MHKGAFYVRAAAFRGSRAWDEIYKASYPITSAVIGYLALSYGVRLSLLPLFVPVLWIYSPNRYIGFLCLFAYNISVARGLLPGAAVFLSHQHSFMGAFFLWSGMNFAISMPFFLFYPRCRSGRALIFPCLCAVTYILPPLSILSVANPLCATGLLFPHSGLIGLMLIFLVYIACTVKRVVLTIFICVIGVLFFTPESCLLPNNADSEFYSINTSFGLLGSGSSDFTNDFMRSSMVFSCLSDISISSLSQQNILLPETIAGRANGISLDLWRYEISKIRRPSQIVLWGAELPTEGGKYDNCLLMYAGNEISSVTQRVPVPYSMYKGPFSTEGANLHYLDNGILALPNGRRAAVLICYEVFLTWPLLRSFVADESPDMLISVGNLWWCKDTSIPASYYRIIALWGRLFGVPVVTAVNI